MAVSPNRLRWDPLPIPSKPADFLDGLVTIAGSCEPAAQTGLAVHVYRANRSMGARYFYDADGELMLVPQQGELSLFTELGILKIKPGEIAVIPRGMKFRVDLEGPSRGYVCENYGAPFRLPELGPIGSQGLAQARHFLAPVAAYEKRPAPAAWSPSSRAGCGRRGSRIRRSTSSPGTATTCRTSTTSRTSWRSTR